MYICIPDEQEGWDDAHGCAEDLHVPNGGSYVLIVLEGISRACNEIMWLNAVPLGSLTFTNTVTAGS
jgi:hypothetical protein